MKDVNKLIEEYEAISVTIFHTLENDRKSYMERAKADEYFGYDVIYNILQKSAEEADEFNTIYKNYLSEEKKFFSISSMAVLLRSLWENLKTICYFFNFKLSNSKDIEIKVKIYEYQMLSTCYYLRKFNIDKFVNKDQAWVKDTMKDLKTNLEKDLKNEALEEFTKSAIKKVISSNEPYQESFIIHKDLDLIDRSYFTEEFKRLYTLLSSFAHCGAFSLGIYGLRAYEKEGSKSVILFYEYMNSILANIFIEYKSYCNRTWSDAYYFDTEFGPNKLNLAKIIEQNAKIIRKPSWKLDFKLKEQ